ncbi:hypothetical protein CQW23_17974 [Capsicum baccatum]|uniref:Uncharacterized protein n=1 Tax=Capsicum baccatum TaxID=33114 RepID=A0A2G2WFK8_CAPBA|nr:hypothetical protein CQW23_17974 [Capsicum baccatum]
MWAAFSQNVGSGAQFQAINKIAERLNIHAIIPETPNWISKVQVVGMGRPGEGIKRKIKYLNMILQDEQDNQVKATVYGDDIPLYQDIFHLFHTYLIMGACIQPAVTYTTPLHTFDWIIDKKTIVDPIDKNDSDEIELPPPRIVNATSFQDINNQASRASKSRI